DTSYSTRIRDNQRRSRARRKDLIEQLQNRVHEFEIKGVSATQEMQRAARKVDQENTRLRALLSLHGISHEEVDTYLRSFDEIRDRLDSSTVVANNLLPVQDGVLEVKNTSTCFCAPTTRVRDQSPNSGLEISCETAATIIADMRGDGDKERVRASLGCRKGEECNVKNTIVLQIMDER
ncbi:hypothetical protein B0J11DRAFT_438128, partial [Dendryphion nanum]